MAAAMEASAKERVELSRIKVRLATLENVLKRKIALCVRCLPVEMQEKYVISPSSSMNSMFDTVSSTPRSASGIV